MAINVCPPLAVLFCAVLLLVLSGTMGLKGHLTCGEIIEQLVHAVRVTPIRNIVFMVRECTHAVGGQV